MAVVAWLLAVSTVVVAGAMLLAQLQFMGLVPTSLSELAATVSNTGPGGGSTPDNVDKTYCYASVLTQARDRSPSDPPAGPHCFTVSSSTGTFTSVFALPSTGHDGPDHDVLPGHVIPGLWDGHGHILHLGELLHSVDLFGSSSPAEMVARVEAYYEEAAAGGVGSRDDWLRGLGWDQMAMGRMPTAVRVAWSLSMLQPLS